MGDADVLNARLGPSSNPNSGQGLLATKDISPGEAVLTLRRAQVDALDIDRLKDTCANCFWWSEQRSVLEDPDIKDQDALSHLTQPVQKKVRACTGCGVLRYCSKKCQSAAWKRTHKGECKLLKLISDRKKDASLPNLVRGAIAMVQLTPSRDSSPFKNLSSHTDDILREGGQRAERLEALSVGVHHYSGTKLGLHYVRQCIAWLFTNSLTLWTPTYDSLGMVLDPLLAKANHSCDANAITVFDGPKISLRALKPIAAGQEVFISYIDPTNPSHVRRLELSTRFYFDCTCEKCLLGTSGATDEYLEDPDKLPTDWLEKRNIRLPPRLKEKLSQKVKDTQSPSDAQLSRQRHELNILESSARATLEELQQPHNGAPSHELAMYTSMVIQFKQTRLFPFQHQPIPAIFHAIYVQRLNHGCYGSAFRIGLYIALDLNPQLYPQEFHPVRVVHLWSLVMLANYLLMLARAGLQAPASEQEQYDYTDAKDLNQTGVHLATTGLILANDVVNQVENSHGLDNRFSATVLRVVGDMEDMRKRRCPQGVAIDIGHAKEWLANEMPNAEDVHKNKNAMRKVADDARDLKFGAGDLTAMMETMQYPAVEGMRNESWNYDMWVADRA